MAPPQNILQEIIDTIVTEITLVAPRIFFTLLALTMLASIWKLVRAYLFKLLEFAELDKGIEKLIGKTLPVSLPRLIVGIADAGIIIIGILLSANILLPTEYRDLFLEGMFLLGKMASILIIAVIILTIFHFLIIRMQIETKLRSYLFFISFIILTALLVDISALSSEVKTALVSGLSQGIGLSIAIFAAWFFFGDYIKRYLEEKAARKAADFSPGAGD